MIFPGHFHPGAGRTGAFTLLELLVSTVVIVLLLGLLLAVTGSVGTTIGQASSRLDAFATARAAFDVVVHRLGQATLNPYYGYLDAQGRAESDPYYQSGSAPAPFTPARYGRLSDLQFLMKSNVQTPGCGQEVYFVSPLACSTAVDTAATPGLLSAGSYFVHYGTDADFLPATKSAPSFRYRLMQAVQPTEKLRVFASVALGDDDWLADIRNVSGKPGRCVSPLAENVLVLALWPRGSETDDPEGTRLTRDYSYDSHPAPVADPTGQPGDGEPTAAHRAGHHGRPQRRVRRPPRRHRRRAARSVVRGAGQCRRQPEVHRFHCDAAASGPQ